MTPAYALEQDRRTEAQPGVPAEGGAGALCSCCGGGSPWEVALEMKALYVIRCLLRVEAQEEEEPESPTLAHMSVSAGLKHV